MKKIVALLVALCMVLSLCPALAEETQALKDARSYINLMYKNKPASTPKDYELVGSVPGDEEVFTVEWSTDSDTIAVIREENGLVKIDVDENNPKEVAYKLTATLLDKAGNSVQISFDRFVPAAINLDVMTEEEIVAVAYTLNDQAKLPAATALCGEIVAIPSAYSEQYGNITVNIQVGDLADQLIQCYRLKGDGVADLKVGDHIAVFGVIKNYKGTIEFDAGCTLIPDAFCQSARVAGFVYGLEEGAAMSRESTMSGVISAIPSAYSEEYKNITVNIDVPGLEGYTVQCYRLTGEGAADLKEGDAITVTGTIKNYKGTIEFDKGCTFVPFDAAEAAAESDADLQAIMQGLMNSELTGENGAGLESLLGGLLGGEAVGEDGAGLESMLGGLLGGSEDVAGLESMLSGLLGGSDEDGSAETMVMSFLNGLGIDTAGLEDELSSGLSNLGSSAESLFGSVQDGLGGLLGQLGDGLNAFLGELNEGAEQTRSSAASEIEELKATLEDLLKEAMEKDPEGEATKKLSELLEAAKKLVEDDEEALEAFFYKFLEFLSSGN